MNGKKVTVFIQIYSSDQTEEKYRFFSRWIVGIILIFDIYVLLRRNDNNSHHKLCWTDKTKQTQNIWPIRNCRNIRAFSKRKRKTSNKTVGYQKTKLWMLSRKWLEYTQLLHLPSCSNELWVYSESGSQLGQIVSKQTDSAVINMTTSVETAVKPDVVKPTTVLI